MVRAHPALLAVPPGGAARVLRALQAAGLVGEDLRALLRQYPGVLGRECAPWAVPHLKSTDVTNSCHLRPYLSSSCPALVLLRCSHFGT
jgi:hypothetical protein